MPEVDTPTQFTKWIVIQGSTVHLTQSLWQTAAFVLKGLNFASEGPLPITKTRASLYKFFK